jgi:hypothetical protein
LKLLFYKKFLKEVTDVIAVTSAGSNFPKFKFVDKQVGNPYDALLHAVYVAVVVLQFEPGIYSFINGCK